MRISDWSSDVCSSDLIPIRTGSLKPIVKILPTSSRSLISLHQYRGTPLPVPRWLALRGPSSGMRRRGFTVYGSVSNTEYGHIRWAGWGWERLSRLEERHVGKGGVRTGRFRCGPDY